MLKHINTSAPIWLILPNEDLVETARNLLRDKENLLNLCQIYCADTTDALPIARSAIESNAQVIISRGGTATLIQEFLPHFPTVRIRHDTALMAARYALLQREHGKENVLLVASNDFFDDKATLRGLETIGYKQNIEIYSEPLVSDRNLTFLGLASYLKKRIINIEHPFIFGSTSATRIAKSLGVPYETIQSTEDAIHDAIKESMQYLRKAFVGLAMEIPEVEVCFEKGIKPVLKEFGFKVISHMDRHTPELIIEEISKEIRTATLVLIDVTGERQNCYYEIGFAKACGKDIIITLMANTHVHFNVSGERRIIWQSWSDLESKLRHTLTEMGHRMEH